MTIYPEYLYTDYPMDNYSCGMRQMLHYFRCRHNTKHGKFYRNKCWHLAKHLRAFKEVLP